MRGKHRYTLPHCEKKGYMSLIDDISSLFSFAWIVRIRTACVQLLHTIAFNPILHCSQLSLLYLYIVDLFELLHNDLIASMDSRSAPYAPHQFQVMLVIVNSWEWILSPAREWRGQGWLRPTVDSVTCHRSTNGTYCCCHEWYWHFARQLKS